MQGITAGLLNEKGREIFMEKKETFLSRARRDLKKNRGIYLMAIPVLAFYICFCYIPIYGLQIAFKDFGLGTGIWGSPWVGFKHFTNFFTGPYFGRTLRNTLLISLYTILVCFPAPIVFALLLNEVKNKAFKKSVQTVSYLPHFISLVVICGIIKEFTQSSGLINSIINLFGGTPETMLLNPDRFRSIYVLSDLWQTIGWNSIIYLAALSGIDPTLYDAASVDGAGRFRKIINVTLPGLLPTIIIMFILRMGQFMSVGYDKILLLYNTNTYETADVISTFVYRKGLIESNFSFSAAVSLFNSLVNFILVVAVNKFSAKVSETSLW